MLPAQPARLLWAALLALTAAATTPGATPVAKEFRAQTSAALEPLPALNAAKDYPAALALVEPLAAAAPPGSYEAYALNQLHTQLLLAANRLDAALAAATRALALADANPGFASDEGKSELLHLLGQLHYQQAFATTPAAAQAPGLTRALAYAERGLAAAPRASVETRLFAASRHYQLGTLDPVHPDSAHLRAALAHAGEGLLLAGLTPPSPLRLLPVAAHLALGETEPACDQLELLAADPAAPAATGGQLVALYLARAAEAATPAESDRLHLRALFALDRAQAAGQLRTPQDNYTRIALWFNLQRYRHAATLLEQGLADASLEPNRRNWELLATAYQQTDQAPRARDALTRAVARLPADANLEFTLAQCLYRDGQLAAAFARGESAAAKGPLESPGPANLLLAQLAYELQRYDEAARWAERARAAGGVPADALDALHRAVDAARRQPTAPLRR